MGVSFTAIQLPLPAVSGLTMPVREPQPLRLLIEKVPASVPPLNNLKSVDLSGIVDAWVA